jgi:hypothetical protein
MKKNSQMSICEKKFFQNNQNEKNYETNPGFMPPPPDPLSFLVSDAYDTYIKSDSSILIEKLADNRLYVKL